jgi:hypothetical protein
MNLGLPQFPNWLINLFAALACIGLATVAYHIGRGLWAIARHLWLVW